MSSLPLKYPVRKVMSHCGEWMVVEFSLQEELALEHQARQILGTTDHEEVTKLCAQLARQTAYHQKLMTQAVRYIAELEIKLALADDVASLRPWWKRLLGRQ